jgi:acetyl esterase/lipase
MSLRYRAVVTALQSLRGEPVARMEPSHGAVAYRPGGVRRGHIAPLADIYVPARPIGASALLVHGGGFVIGSRRMKPVRFLAAQLVTSGIAVCAVDYRMIFRGGRLAEAIDDVQAAFDFWSTRAGELALDPDALALVGLSAGATLAHLAAARLAPGRLAALVCCFGLYEVDHLRGPAAVLPRLLLRSSDRASWAARMPRHAAQPAVPTLLLHGGDDGLVPVEQAQRLAAHRGALGLPTRLVIYDGAPHGFFSSRISAADAAVREIVAYVEAARARPGATASAG